MLLWGDFFFSKQRILRRLTHKRYCLLVVCPKAATEKQFSPPALCGREECPASHRRFSAPNCLPWKSFLPLPLLLPTAKKDSCAILLLMQQLLDNCHKQSSKENRNFGSITQKQCKPNFYLKHGHIFFFNKTFFFVVLLVFTIPSAVSFHLMSERVKTQQKGAFGWLSTWIWMTFALLWHFPSKLATAPDRYSSLFSQQDNLTHYLTRKCATLKPYSFLRKEISATAYFPSTKTARKLTLGTLQLSSTCKGAALECDINHF